VLVSALSGEGLDALFDAIDARLGVNDQVLRVAVEPSAGKLIHWLHEHTDVLDTQSDDDGHITYRIRLALAKRGQFDGQLARYNGRLLDA
jgi:GTPase